ncbi:MMPL family transporter, partial [bacterium]|nr:MMPL family transporter [bacterium]
YYLSTNDLVQIRDSLRDFRQLVAILAHRPKLDTFLDSMNQMLGQMGRASAAEGKQMEAFVPTVTAIVRQLGTAPAAQEGADWLSPWSTALFSEQMVGEAEKQMRWGGYQVFREGRMFVVLVHPRGVAKTDGQAPAPHNATIPKLSRILSEVQRQHPDVQINLTGEPVLDYDEMRESERDAIQATLLTLVVCGLIFAFGFHEWVRPLLGTACIVLVISLSLGWATVSVGYLNIITVTFAVMLVGMGIDLGIQLLARYEEALTRGVDRVAAVRTAVEQTGPSLITAGVTNAAAFFAMGLSGFRGVTELGIIAGGGMLIAVAVTLLVLPSLLLVVRRRRESTHIPAQAAATRFERWLLRWPVAVLMLCLGLTVAGVVLGWRVRFDYNVLNLQTKGLPSVDTEMKLLRADAESTIFAAVVCPTIAATRTLHEQLERLPTTHTVHSIAELIPEGFAEKAPILRAISEQVGDTEFAVPPWDPADAEAILRSLGGMRLRASRLVRSARDGQDPDGERVLQALATAAAQTRQALQTMPDAERQGRLAHYERQFYADLGAQLRLLREQRVDAPLGVADLPPEVRRMLVGKSGKFLIRVFPRENIWERESLVRFVREVQAVAPGATGTPLGLYEFVDILQRGYINAALWAFLVIVIVILIDFRGVLATILTVVPLVTGIVWMVGAMVVLDLPFNPANIMVLPLMVGIGVAYGIYVVQRYREDHEATFYGKSTGRAVLLSALTTIAAFATLIAASHRGIRSLGIVMCVGTAACLLASMVMLPALLGIARRRGWRV